MNRLGWLLAAFVLCPSAGWAQSRQEPGRSIGTITTQGSLIVMTLNEGALGTANLFDLAHRTLRFTPDGDRYRVENLPEQWDAEFGPAMTSSRATLATFAFPFAKKNWSSFSAGMTGSMTFDDSPPANGRGGGGLSVARFAELQEAAPTFTNGIPAISVFFKPRMSGTRYLKELGDRAVVTWTLTEPVGGIQDMTWTPTVNRFQAVLHKDGTIELTYDDVHGQDGIVGVYTTAGKLAGTAVDFSSVKKSDGPFAAAYEAFHYMKPPRAVDLTCTVINALGDKFDMLAYYSDFRIDNPEAGTSSNGPLGGGPNGGAVTGIGANQRSLANYCTQGRFQWQYIQPVYVGANQMAEYPPPGVTDTNSHNVTAYAHQLAERTSNGKIPPYDYAMSQIGHEMGHRWSAFVSAKVSGETIQLGPTHWARGLQAPVAFPYQRPVEASAMGGGVWQDNLDGTFTQLDDDYYVPATGWSYLDLYLMGLIAPSEVPDFFILRNLVPQGRDASGRPIFKADRTRVTIQDVIAVEGPRLPDVDHSQKDFNTGMVVVVEHGKTPSKELLERTEGIRLRWMDYWTTTTGHRSTMTTNPADEGYIASTDSVRLFYRVVGHGRDTIIAVHGGPGVDLESIYGDFTPLTEKHVVIFYDQRGAGRSTLPRDTTVLNATAQIADLDAVRRHFKIDRPILVAHSYGPLLAATYAIAHPDHVRAMVLLGAVPPHRGDFWQRFGRTLNSRMDSTQRAKSADANRRLAAGQDIRQACRDYWAIALRPRLADPNRTFSQLHSDLCASDPAGIRYGLTTTNRIVMASYGDWDLRPSLKTLNVPTLIVHGEEDAIPMDLVSEWTLIPNSRLVRVPHAAHMLYAERPEIVWPEVERFLSGLPRQ